MNIDELYNYVYRNVTHTAASRNRDLPQTPVRKIGFGLPGQPVVLYLKPQSLDQVLSDMAQQLSDAIASRNLGKVGVLEFTNDTKLGELLGADYGLLGKYCASKLEDGLVQEQHGRYKVVNKRTLALALKEQQFQLADLGSGEALKKLAAKTGGMPVIAVGMLHGRLGAKVNLRCQLIEADNNEVVTVVGGEAWISESQFAMLGRSFEVSPDARRPELPQGDQPTRPIEHVVIDRIDRQSEGAHPLKDPAFPFRVWIVVNGQERKGEFRGNDYCVPLRKNETYSIYIENRSGQLIYMRLLVDGLNTNLESDAVSNTASTSDGESKGLTTEIIGKPVNLEVARGWVLDPNDKERLESARINGGNPNLYGVAGFVTTTGKDGGWNLFTVVDAEHSLAARQNFTSQIGLITAAFYNGVASTKSGGGTRGNGTTGGRNVKVKLETMNVAAGNLLGVVNIRYYDPDAPASNN